MASTRIIFLLFLLTTGISVSAQRNDPVLFKKNIIATAVKGQTKNDSLIVIKYLNDTLQFTPYPGKTILPSIVPSENISYWELNQCNGSFKGKDFRSSGFHIEYQNVFRSTEKKLNPFNDTLVLTKSETGFATSDPIYNWYISGKLKNGSLQSITNNSDLSSFLGTLNNPFNAYFWLACSVKFYTKIIPQEAYRAKYKALPNGYLIIADFPVSNCPFSGAGLLYFVGKDKQVVFIQLLNLNISSMCI